jgi:NAD(P)H-hydrate epimerase
MSTEFLTPLESRRIDENCVGLGISKLQLMENAGRAVAICAMNKFATLPLQCKRKIAVICGLGNNGGDGLVAARHLSRNCDVYVILIGTECSIKTKETRNNWNTIKKMDTSIKLVDANSMFSPKSPLMRLDEFDLIIDGIFGTGIRGTVQEPESSIIDILNASSTYKISIDLPSGYGTNKVVNTDYSVVLHRPKAGVLLEHFEVADIGIPIEAEVYTGRGDLLYKRKADSHKGENGRVLVIGGGPYTGAPTLSAMAAMKSGVDVVTVATPRENIIAGYSPNLIVKKAGTEKISTKDVDYLSELINRNDSIVMGPGLGTDAETTKAVSSLIPICKRLALDADGLKALHNTQIEDGCVIITPHQKEFELLIGEEVPREMNDEKIKLVTSFSRDRNVVTLLKGRIDIISDGNKYRLNKNGNPGMTVGGTGDALVGIVGAWLTRANGFNAASTAAYVSKSAGDLAFKKLGYSLLATDVIENIPRVMKGGVSRSNKS